MIQGKTTFALTVTVTDHTKGPFSLDSLFNTGSQTGVTVAGNPSAGVPHGCAWFQIQSLGPGNLFMGDSGVKNDGTQQGVKIIATDVAGPGYRAPAAGANSIELRDHYIMADTDNLVFNIQAWFV